MAFWTTFLALALGPLDQFQKKFLGTIYQIWWGIGPIFSLLGPKMWEELRCKGIKWLLLYKGRDLSDFLAHGASILSFCMQYSLAAKLMLINCERFGNYPDIFLFKERKGCGAVLHSNGQDPVLASLVYTGPEFKIRNQGAIRGIYNESQRRNYSMEEELTVPIVNVATEAAVRQAMRQNPHTNALIVRNQGMFIWAENWQRCQAM